MTLVELVLAIGMFSFLMASVGSLILTSLRVQRTWGSAVAPFQSAEHALARLAGDLQAAQPLFDVPFRGNVDEPGLEFARLGPVTDAEGLATTDWLRIVYRFDHADEGVTLVREEFLWRAGKTGVEPLRHERLARMANGQWMFGKVNTDKELTWTLLWDGTTDGIPRLVKFDGTLPARGSRAPVALSRIIRNPAGKLPEVPP